MSRFDSLKGNTFTSSNNRPRDDRRRDDRPRDDRPRDDRRRDDRPRNDRPRNDRVDDRNFFKEKKKKEFSTTEEDFPDLLKPVEGSKENEGNPKEESKWLKAIEKQNESEVDSRFIINPNDPHYWRGAQWTGPMMMRQKKPTKRWESYFNMISQKKVSTIVIPHSGTEYSRDGTNWHKSWNDTFTQEQLQAMDDEENEKMLHQWYICIEENYEKRRLESEQYYYETGELDGFAKAELDRIEYEEYAKQFEIDEEEVVEDDEEEYLEDD